MHLTAGPNLRTHVIILLQVLLVQRLVKTLPLGTRTVVKDLTACCLGALVRRLHCRRLGFGVQDRNQRFKGVLFVVRIHGFAQNLHRTLGFRRLWQAAHDRLIVLRLRRQSNDLNLVVGCKLQRLRGTALKELSKTEDRREEFG